MSTPRSVSVIICMGSSCFSRGNNRNIEVIQSLAENSGGGAAIETRGHLCEGLCRNGPNLLIDGRLYQQADPVTVAGALNYHLAHAPPNPDPGGMAEGDGAAGAPGGGAP